MKTRSQNTYHIVRRVGKEGMRLQESRTNLGSKICTTGSATSLEKHSDGNHAQRDLPAGPPRVTLTKTKGKDKIQKWRRGGYKEVMYAFYMSLEKPDGSHTEHTFRI